MFLKRHDRAKGSPRSRSRRESGSASVEMVFILPLALLLVFAICDFGLAFARYQLVINAAHEGARVASLNRSPCNAGGVNAAARATAQSAFSGLGVNPTDANVTATGACTPGDAQVTVTYQHNFPIIASFSSLPGTLNLAYTAVRATEVPNPGGTP